MIVNYICAINVKNFILNYFRKIINLIKLEKDKDMANMLSGFCSEKNHKLELKYFCKRHNILCCAQCVTKIKGKENGQHSDCDICFIEDIENEKRNKLKDNIKCLEDISINLEQKIKELKLIYEKIEKSKEELITNIQKTFTKLRSTLNDREEELLQEVDNKYALYFNENIIKDCDKLPNKIKISLEKGKEIENNWNNNQLNLLINNCINIENNINNIKLLNEIIEKTNNLKINIKFLPKEDGINQLLDSIKKFGEISSKKLFESNIYFNEELIETWLNNRKFEAELLFRKSRDGSTPNDFHNKCDNKGITITFIETTKGYKFGGYTELPWDKSNIYKKDESTFIFSFNKKQKYTSSKNNYSIACDSSSGPRFGYNEIYLYQTLDKGRTFDHDNYSFLRNGLLTNGEEYWDVKELEVHKINYLN